MKQPKHNLFFRYLILVALQALILTVTSSTFAQQQKGKIRGQVFGTGNKPAENVSVILKGTHNGTQTDENGNYVFRVDAGAYTLIISHVGAQSQQVEVKVTAGQTTKVPDLTINVASGALLEINVSDNRTNKFAKKSSDIVAKMPLNNLENPQVYTTIGKELLAEQNVFSVDDAIKNAPGIQKMWDATGRGGDGGAYYNSRGFIIQSQLRNGIAGNVTNTVDGANIERIEIIKGPSATLFGSTLTSYGGLINRVTKKPFEAFGTDISYAAGSYGFNRVSADVNTPIDADKKVLFRLNTAFNYQGSFQNNGFNRNAVIAPSLLYKASSRLSFLFDAELFYGKGTGKTIYFFPYGQTISSLGASRADQLNIDYKKSYTGGDLAQTSRSTNFFGQMNYKISDHWTSQTNFTSTTSFSDGFGGYYYLLPKDSISRNDQSTKNSYDYVTEVQQNFNGDFKIGNLRNRFVGGLDYFRRNSQQFFYGSTYDVVSLTSSAFNYNQFNRANMDALYSSGKPYGFTYPSIFITNTYSAYISDVLNLTDRFLVLAALRIDRFNNLGNYDPATQKTTGAYNQTAFSPKFGLVYQLVKNEVSLFANYQNGFTNQTGTDYAGKTFKPEQANQIEGGVKLDAFDGKLSSTISYYSIKVQDIVRPYDANFSIQDGTQISKGFETEVISNPFKGANIIAGFSYNDSKYEKSSDDVSGRRPGTASSPYQANLWLSYRLPQQAVKGLGFGFGGNYASDNTIINSVSQGVFVLPSYTLLNAATFFDRPKYRIGLNVNNLTNKKYWVGYTTVSPQMLRQFVGSVTFKFK